MSCHPHAFPKHYSSVLLAFFLAVFTVACDGKRESERINAVTVNNVEPRRDVTGEIVDAHDGCLQFFNGRYYLYGTAYGKTDGYTNNSFRVYSSPDLAQWTFEGELLRGRPEGIYYRPYVVFNPNTRQYVLWYNWYPKLWDGRVGVATSDTPLGPFTVVNSNVPITGFRPGDTNVFGARPGDGSLFVDDDGTGYYIYTSIGDGYAVRVQRLKPDYLGPIGKTSNILAKGAEAPVLFRRKNLYYVLCGPLCAFCPEGSQVQVFTSESPLGPFSVRSNINQRPNDTNAPIVSAQQTWVTKIPTPEGPAFIWIADRWKSSSDGIKGHDFQFWSAPLKFTPDGDILPIKEVARWYITRVAGN
jgi:hypothetical protein